jgi:hypothetical protein
LTDTELVPVQQTALAPRAITPDTLAMILQLAPTIHASRMFPGVSSPEQAAVIMLTGAELGFSFTASFSLIEMIQNKAALKPQGALALIHRSGNFNIDIEEQNGVCQVAMTRHDTGFSYCAQFTLDDAKRAGLVKPGGAWTTYPTDMLKWRAIARCARVVAPDVLAGLYLSPELERPSEEASE